MLEKVEYVFPRNTENEKLFEFFSRLFKDVPYANINDDKIIVGFPELKPITIFRIGNTKNVQVDIDNPKYLDLMSRGSRKSRAYPEARRLPIQEVADKLAGHVFRLDHTGIDLAMSLYSTKEWGDLLEYLGSVGNIYNYPTGEPWPFMLPATEKEHADEIIDFSVIREPRFEPVREDDQDISTLHIDIGTDLSKEEVEALFPGDKGIYFNSLENIYKAIYLDYDGEIEVRLDIRFKSPRGDFASGKWLVEEGDRIK